MKVLVAEDEPISRHRLITFLKKWGYEVQVARDGAEALHMLDEPGSPKLAILDRMMPHVNGLDVCRAVREAGREPYVYMILLTGQGRQEEIIEGFEAGADDYIKKPFESQELKARLRTGARIVELQEELIAARERLREEAMHDSLTGLLNRAAFFTIFGQEVARSRRRDAPLALIMADVDHFKAINDRYGHVAGDAVLREVAKRLRIALRSSDLVGRYGGEEFVVLVPACDIRQALAMAERIRQSVSASPIEVPGASVQTTISVGVAGTDDMDVAEELLKRADQALYRAKHAGRNKVELAV